MSGSLSGHGGSWPTPNVIAAALRSALHRAEIEAVHAHRVKKRDHTHKEERSYQFGSLVSAGPWPVSNEDLWYFSTPADAVCQKNENGKLWLKLSHKPLLPLEGHESYKSSLPEGLFPTISLLPPSKDENLAWWSTETFNRYLAGCEVLELPDGGAISGESFQKAEQSVGIGINPETQSIYLPVKDKNETVEDADGSKFFSSTYLRLADGWKMGVLAEAQDKIEGNPETKKDLIQVLIPENRHIVVGGQQKVCTVERNTEEKGMQLPKGPEIQGKRVKWVLLSPAIFPHIGEQTGGWLPNWIHPESMRVELLDGPGKAKAKRLGINAGKPIQAKLVAAIIGKPLPITQWHLAREGISFDDEETLKDNSGPRPTLLAVPPGSVYYFEADTEEDARKLAAQLNWHGDADQTHTIKNRRSTLLGEKGFGLGVCGTWKGVESKSN